MNNGSKHIFSIAFALIAVFSLSSVSTLSAQTTVWLDQLDLSPATQGWSIPKKNRTVDGNIMTIAGKTFQGGNHSLGEGIETERSANAGDYVTKISNGDFIKVRSVDFKKGAGSFQANVASASGGFIEIHVDSSDGELLGSCEVKNTGGLQSWTTVSTKVNKTKGVHDLCFVFKANQGDLFNFNWWKFDK
jgi:hypothetical protein